jgi:oxygen-independent coproporphyrinogen-3 oxidase
MILPVSIYNHIPFCQKKCAYCDFNSCAGQGVLIPDYISALKREISLFAASIDQPLAIQTVYIGGGTPSILSIDQIGSILDVIRQKYRWMPDTEITLEANPGTVSLPKLRGYYQMGVNRLSYGMQSANPEELATLGRLHSIWDTYDAVYWARQAGFTNINLDLIYGLPGQSMPRWENSIKAALGLRPEHISLYQLTIEDGTPFDRMARRGLFVPGNDDEAADMLEFAADNLTAAGYRQYEIANWALETNPGREYLCQHNLQYWHNLPYLGFGAGAHSYYAGYRTSNVAGIPVQPCLG